jgi:hypothetical protein
VIAAFILKFTGTLASAVTFNVPATKHFYRLEHAGTAHTVTAKVAGQTGVLLNPGDIRLVRTDVFLADSAIGGSAVPLVAAPAHWNSAGVAGSMAVMRNNSIRRA